jgi:hypothetical protein
MAIHSNHQGHWIFLEERVILEIILALLALLLIASLFYPYY